MKNQKEISLNICELFEILVKEYGSVDAVIERSQTEAKAIFNRIYVGSYFCESYFLRTIETTLHDLEQYALNKKIRITLVIPIFTQTYVEVGMQVVDKVLRKFSMIDEVVVNDYGTLNNVSFNYNCGIIIGRLLRKRSRDYRYQEYVNSIDYEETKAIYQKYSKVIGTEIDVSSKYIDVSGFDKDILPCIHIPLTYLTCGQICDFASLNSELFQKFKSNSGCDLNCNKLYYLYKTETNHDLYRIGKAVYYKTIRFEILNTKKVRFVYFPFGLWESQYEYFGSDK